MRKFFRTALTCLALAVCAATLCLATGCGAYDATRKEGEASKATRLQVASDGLFTVLQLTDLHLTTNGTYSKDRQTLRWVEEAIQRVNPDLVEVTGDAVAGSGKGRDRALLALANIFEKNRTYWAYTFGNHDGEHTLDENGKDAWIGKEGKRNDLLQYCPQAEADIADTVSQIYYGDNTRGNEELYELLRGYEYALLQRSPEEIADPDAMGVGNYVIELENAAGETVFALIHMDTHGKTYVDPVGNAKGASGCVDVGYVGLTQAQIRWYESQAERLHERDIPSVLFMHVPNFAYRTATEQSLEPNRYGIPQFGPIADAAQLRGQVPQKYADTGVEYIKQEDICAPRWDDGLTAAIARYPGTNLIAVGHEHNNAFVLEYPCGKNSVLLAYGRTSGVNAWSRDIPIGGSVYRIDTTCRGSAVDTYDIWVEYPSFSYAKLGNR